MEETIVQTDAGAVAVRRTAGELPPEDSVATILLHGAAGSWTTWRPLIAALEADRGGPVPDLVVPDLPGWGASPADPSALDAAVLADAVAEVTRALRYRRWRVVGHSLGGFVALELAVREPAAIESVVVVSATVFGARADRLSGRGMLLRYAPLVLLLAGMRVLASLGRGGPALVRTLDRWGVLRVLVSPLFRVRVPGVAHELARDLRPAAFARAVAAARAYPAGERWARIQCPVLAIRGDHDVFVPARDDARLAALIPGWRTVVLPGTGHFAHVEHPTAVARLVTASMGRNTPSRSRHNGVLRPLDR
ncbi:alpha/beta hydrolase [Leifsonia sp. NPDC077715]|uniref:alpha/beta fold hydrolase n=1 Tax=Leifsonia sp. NPDC077715 TaxID=3155539 RepID=UPI003440FAD7